MTRTERLIASLERTLDLARAGKLDAMLERTWDWTDPGKVPSTGTRGGGLATATPEQVQVDRAEDRKAARMHRELLDDIDTIVDRSSRIEQRYLSTHPKPPRKIQGKDMLASQVAAAGLCVSCWRYDQTQKERERDGKGNYYDKEACRSCADFKREHGIYPPLELLKVKHGQLKNWNTAMVDEALAGARGKKAG